MTTSQPNTDLDRFTVSLFEIAAAIDAQEQRIKQCLLRASRRGDAKLVQELMELWLTGSIESVAEFVREAQPQAHSRRTDPLD